MPTVTFIEHSQVEHVIEIEEGVTLMSAAVENLIPGIEGECGGSCACATCHVHVDEAWFDKVGGPGSMEDALLEFSDHRAPTSRLSCQIEMTSELDGLIVTVPGTDT